MNRTNMVLLTPTGEEERQLRSLAEASARLWNMANHERRQALFFQNSWTPTYARQCRRFKDADAFKQLGTCKAQALLVKLREAWGSYRALKQLEERGQLPPPHIKRVRPPRYMKNRQTRSLVAESIYVRNDGYKQREDALVLSKSLRVRFRAGELWVGKQGRLELHYDRVRGKWYGHIPVRVKWSRKGKPHQPTRKRVSIDLGICNLATCVVDGAEKA